MIVHDMRSCSGIPIQPEDADADHRGKSGKMKKTSIPTTIIPTISPTTSPAPTISAAPTEAKAAKNKKEKKIANLFD